MEPAGQVVPGPAQPQHRDEGHEQPDRSRTPGNKIIINRGGTDPGLNSQILHAIPSIYPLSSKQYGDDTGHPVFWGGGGYPTLWNEAPFRNNQDLFVLKDDYSAVFGKHFVKAGLLGSTNVKNEDSNGNGSVAELGVLGLDRLDGSAPPPATSWATSCSRT